MWDDFTAPSTKRHGMKGKVVRRLVLVRHCESESNVGLTTQGDASVGGDDPPLSKRGEIQSHYVQAFLKKASEQTCFEVSPMQRAIQTVGDAVKYSVVLSVHERNTKKNRTLKDGTVIKRETNEQYEKRVRENVMRWRMDAALPSTVVVVGHSIFIQSVLQVLAGAPLTAPSVFHLGNGCVSIVDFTVTDESVKMAELQVVGGVEHLPSHLRSGQHTAYEQGEYMQYVALLGDDASSMKDAVVQLYRFMTPLEVVQQIIRDHFNKPKFNAEALAKRLEEANEVTLEQPCTFSSGSEVVIIHADIM